MLSLDTWKIYGLQVCFVLVSSVGTIMTIGDLGQTTILRIIKLVVKSHLNLCKMIQLLKSEESAVYATITHLRSGATPKTPRTTSRK